MKLSYVIQSSAEGKARHIGFRDKVYIMTKDKIM